MNICLVSDNNYAIYIETLIVSILRNSDKEDFFHFHIIEENISKESKDKINKLKEIKNFNIDFYTPPSQNIEKYKEWTKYFKTKIPWHHWNHMVWYKLDILFLFRDMDKILFLDADSIAINNIKNIYEKDVENNYAIASQFKLQNLERELPKLYKWIKEVVENDDSDEEPYYLSGAVILFNLKKIREEIDLEKLDKEINYCFDNYKDIIFTEEHFFMYLFKNKISYEDVGLDECTNNKVNFVSMYFATTIGKPISKNFNRPINEYFHKFWEYFTQTISFKSNANYYLEIYYYTRNKEEEKLIIEEEKKVLFEKDQILISKINKIVNKIVWYIPIRKMRDSIREKLLKDLEI